MAFGLAKKNKWKLFLPAILLSCIGLATIYIVSQAQGDFINFEKQSIFFVISVSLVAAFSLLDLRFLKRNSYIVFFLYLASLLSLLGLFFFGARIRHVRGWYKLGIFSIDPVPFAVIILIIVLAKYFSTRHIEIRMARQTVYSGMYFVLPFVLVLMQPDLGSALILAAAWLGIIVLSGISIKHFAVICLLALIIMGLSWQFFLKNYQRQRIMNFLGEDMDAQGVSWNINQSKIAIGSGGILGKGFLHGDQSRGGLLPEAQTDFIFSAFAEEFGLVGVSVLLFLFGFLFWQIMKIALYAQSNFVRLFASGFAFVILAQSFINIGMTLGILPIIGIPLPFVSYGGSNLLAFYSGLGILAGLSSG